MRRKRDPKKTTASLPDSLKVPENLMQAIWRQKSEEFSRFKDHFHERLEKESPQDLPH